MLIKQILILLILRLQALCFVELFLPIYALGPLALLLWMAWGTMKENELLRAWCTQDGPLKEGDSVTHQGREMTITNLYKIADAVSLKYANTGGDSVVEVRQGAATIEPKEGAFCVHVGRAAEITPGALADLVIFEVGEPTIVRGPFRTRGVNEPLVGRSLLGRVVATVVAGRVVYGPITLQG